MFSIESFTDELAQAAGFDLVQMRRNHLQDARARAAIDAAAGRFGGRLSTEEVKAATGV